MQHSRINNTKSQYNNLYKCADCLFRSPTTMQKLPCENHTEQNIIYVNCQPNLTYKEIELRGSVDNKTAVGNILVILTFME